MGLIKPPREAVFWFIRWDTVQLRSWWFLMLVPVLQIMGLFWWGYNWTNMAHLMGFLFGIAFVLLLPKKVSMGSTANRFSYQFQI